MSASYRFRFVAALGVMLIASGCAGATSSTTVEVPDKSTVKNLAAQGGKETRLTADEYDTRSVNEKTSTSRKKSTSSITSSGDPIAAVQANQTGTFVGQRTQELANDIIKVRSVVETRADTLDDIRRAAANSAVTYHSSTAAIEARLQSGTTPGNPILLRQWDEAQANLDQMNSSVSRLNTLSTEVSADGSMVGYLLGSVKAAFELNGAVDEDHDNLKVLQDVVAAHAVSIERMKTEISADLLRLNSYVNTERSNLQTLAFSIDRGEYLGNNLQNRPVTATPASFTAAGPMAVPVPAVQKSSIASEPAFDPYARTGVATGTADTSFGVLPADSAIAASPYAAPQTQNLTELPPSEDNKTLALIRFSKENVAYEKQLYDAVANALDQMPAAVFTVVAVAPGHGNSAEVAARAAEAQRYADGVKRSLISMGLPPARIAMSATGSSEAAVPEVRVLVR